jgi:hypothetical protein
MPVEEFRARALDVEPLIIIGAMEAWPALRDWSDLEKLKTRAGDARGRVEVGINFLDPVSARCVGASLRPPFAC